MLADLALPTGSTPSEAEQAGIARLINAFVEPVEQGKSQMVISAVDGLTSFATLTDGGGIRALHEVSADEMLAVAGRLCFRLDQAGNVTLLGGVPSDGMVTSAQNRLGEVAIVCDGLYFGYSSGVLRQLADPDLEPPVSVTEMGGHLLFLTADGRHFASEVDSWDVDALSFASAEARADGGVRNTIRGSDHVIFGRKSAEFWALTGDDPYPLARTTFIDVGCLSGGSVATVDQSIAWVAHDGTVRILEGYNARSIGSREVERLIADDPSPSTITATSHYGRGRTFYTLSGTNWTREYNVATGRWHERRSYGSNRWKVSHVAMFGSRRVAGDATLGRLYTMSHTAYDEAGDHLVMTAQAAPIAEFPNRIIHHALHVDMQMGEGLVGYDEDDLALTDDGGSPFLMDDGDTLYLYDDGDEDRITMPADVEPMLMIDVIDDGLHAGTQVMRSMGRAGERLKRIRVNRLGSAHSRTYRFSVSAAVRRFIIAAKVDVEQAGYR